MILFNCGKPALFATGDLHGEWGLLENYIKRNLTDCALVVCGDIGLGFESRGYYEQLFKKMNRTFDNLNVEVFLLRGNHDDPTYFSEESDLRDSYPNIHICPDYSVLRMEDIGRNFLLVGGAISVDRGWRIANDRTRHASHMLYHKTDAKFRRSYWVNEPPVYDDNSIEYALNEYTFIDGVFTHTCPSFCDPQSKDGIQAFIDADPVLTADIEAERKVMDDIYAKLVERESKPKVWCYGHYHKHSLQEVMTFVLQYIFKKQVADIAIRQAGQLVSELQKGRH